MSMDNYQAKPFTPNNVTHPTVDKPGSNNVSGAPTFHPIPHTVHVGPQNSSSCQHISNKLPALNHDAALKRAKIQYTGLGVMFLFYSQLLNGMEQFGVYLIPLSNVKYI
jgi:hypothetical protein